MTQRRKIDLIVEAGQVVTLARGPRTGRRGPELADVGVFEKASVAIHAGKIVAVDSWEKVSAQFDAAVVRREHDACVTPGLIDCHTHLVFAGTRERDFYARIRGESYEEIARKGGGIRESVRHLRAASREELKEQSRKRLHQLMKSGVTTCEIKSGYGLRLEDEIKTLEVARELGEEEPIDIVTTFLGAHEVPDEFRGSRAAYLDLLCNEMIPEIAKRKLATFCDVFTEKDVFSIDESRRILECAKSFGLGLKLHADELAEGFGGAELAASLGAVSADHLIVISEKGIAALAASRTVAVLLPATTFFLAKSRYAPARRMAEAGCILALATDLNPGSSNTESLQTVMTLAAVQLKLTPEEILTAVTHNAACALRQEDRLGRLEAGLQADLVVWDLPDYRQIPYFWGGNRVRTVCKAGYFYT